MRERLFTILFAVIRNHNLGIDKVALKEIESQIDIFASTYKSGTKRRDGIVDFEKFIQRVSNHSQRQDQQLITLESIASARDECGLIFWCKTE
ncbi:hypothetical protein [Flagellimonas sp.]|uniref:hypothetical protein n=1 Tax=Flagellimonas sp. TaxID=2058762 RepID=UPI003B528F28